MGKVHIREFKTLLSACRDEVNHLTHILTLLETGIIDHCGLTAKDYEYVELMLEIYSSKTKRHLNALNGNFKKLSNLEILKDF